VDGLIVVGAIDGAAVEDEDEAAGVGRSKHGMKTVSSEQITDCIPST
jgi:hypothetical protein